MTEDEWSNQQYFITVKEWTTILSKALASPSRPLELPWETLRPMLAPDEFWKIRNDGDTEKKLDFCGWLAQFQVPPCCSSELLTILSDCLHFTILCHHSSAQKYPVHDIGMQFSTVNAIRLASLKQHGSE